LIGNFSDTNGMAHADRNVSAEIIGGPRPCDASAKWGMKALVDKFILARVSSGMSGQTLLFICSAEQTAGASTQRPCGPVAKSKTVAIPANKPLPNASAQKRVSLGQLAIS
jgi:hypothetical protein